MASDKYTFEPPATEEDVRIYLYLLSQASGLQCSWDFGWRDEGSGYGVKYSVLCAFKMCVYITGLFLLWGSCHGLDAEQVLSFLVLQK